MEKLRTTPSREYEKDDEGHFIPKKLADTGPSSPLYKEIGV